MSNVTKPTEKEHFIPRMYLQRFSEINQSKKPLIWQFNLRTMQQIPVPVDIRDICFERNLYEIKDDDGFFVAQNRIEKTFGNIEAHTSSVIESIIEKSQNENCLNCPTILSEEDQNYLVIFMTSLTFRDPATIDLGIKFLQTENTDTDIRSARNFTLLNLLPLGVDPEWDKNTIIMTGIKRLCGMAYQIGLTDDDVIITSDRPVIFWFPKEDDPYDRPRAVVFPLTSKLVLYLFPMESVDPIARNCFIRLSKNQINDINAFVAGNARNWIYSRYPLTQEQLETVNEVRKHVINMNMNN